MAYCQKFCLFGLLVTKCGVFLKMTNFSVGQSGAFVMGGVAYGIRAHFKQARLTFDVK